MNSHKSLHYNSNIVCTALFVCGVFSNFHDLATLCGQSEDGDTYMDSSSGAGTPPPLSAEARRFALGTYICMGCAAAKSIGF